MSPRVARWLTSLYPPAWRMRYGEEFRRFLEARPDTLGAVLNVMGCAFYERLCSFGDYKMSRLQHSLVLMGYAYLVAIAAGVNLYMTVDDTPLVDAMRAHNDLSVWWNLVAAGSLVALAAAVCLGLPALWAMIRFARAARRRDIVARLAFPPCALALILIWITAVVMWTGWGPLFWDVMGQPVSRWALSFVTLLLVVVGLFGSGITLKQAVERSTFPDERLLDRTIRPLQFVKIPVLVLAGSIVVMVLGVLCWGLMANQYAPAAFQAQDGGFFGAPNIVSWMGSLALFIASAVTALRGARWTITSQAE